MSGDRNHSISAHRPLDNAHTHPDSDALQWWKRRTKKQKHSRQRSRQVMRRMMRLLLQCGSEFDDIESVDREAFRSYRSPKVFHPSTLPLPVRLQFVVVATRTMTMTIAAVAAAILSVCAAIRLVCE